MKRVRVQRPTASAAMQTVDRTARGPKTVKKPMAWLSSTGTPLSITVVSGFLFGSGGSLALSEFVLRT